MPKKTKVIEVEEVSEAAAVKARWLGNFCPRQPVYSALKRQRSSRDRRLRAGPDGSRKVSGLG